MSKLVPLTLAFVALSACQNAGEPWFYLNEMHTCNPIRESITKMGFEAKTSDGPQELAEYMQRVSGQTSTVVIDQVGSTATWTYHNRPDSGLPDPVYLLVKGEANCQAMAARRKGG